MVGIRNKNQGNPLFILTIILNIILIIKLFYFFNACNVHGIYPSSVGRVRHHGNEVKNLNCKLPYVMCIVQINYISHFTFCICLWGGIVGKIEEKNCFIALHRSPKRC